MADHLLVYTLLYPSRILRSSLFVEGAQRCLNHSDNLDNGRQGPAADCRVCGGQCADHAQAPAAAEGYVSDYLSFGNMPDM